MNPQPFSKLHVFGCVLFVVAKTNQPTKTNTNNNTWPVIQLDSNLIQPTFTETSIHGGASG